MEGCFSEWNEWELRALSPCQKQEQWNSAPALIGFLVYEMFSHGTGFPKSLHDKAGFLHRPEIILDGSMVLVNGTAEPLLLPVAFDEVVVHHPIRSGTGRLEAWR